MQVVVLDRALIGCNGQRKHVAESSVQSTVSRAPAVARTSMASAEVSRRGSESPRSVFSVQHPQCLRWCLRFILVRVDDADQFFIEQLGLRNRQHGAGQHQ